MRGVAGTAHQMGAIMEHNSEDRLSTINVPALVIHGDEDLVVPVENGRLLAAKIKNARIVVLPATGHLYVFAKEVGGGCSRALIRCGCGAVDDMQVLGHGARAQLPDRVRLPRRRRCAPVTAIAIRLLQEKSWVGRQQEDERDGL